MKGIINGKIITEGNNGRFDILERHVLLFDKKIIQIVPSNYFAASQVEELIDAEGLYVSPGFINTHVHGCGGADTMDDDLNALITMAMQQARNGVTSFLATTMTYDMPRIYEALERIRKHMETENPKGIGAKVIGCHMEGPFISEKYKGAQDKKNIQKADFSAIEKYADIIKVITVAPETLEENSEFGHLCAKAGIQASVGHSGADYDTAYKAIMEMGFTRFTHLFNAMSGMHHRNPGVANAALDTWAFTELILDNVHVCPAMQRLVWNIKGPEKLVAITDSMRACGLGDGESELGGQKVYVKGNLATLEDGTIAASVATMDNCVKNLAENVGVPVWEAVECATKTAAKSLDMQYEIGSFEAGNAADIILFDDDVDIKRTIVDGKTVYFKD